MLGKLPRLAAGCRNKQLERFEPLVASALTMSFAPLGRLILLGLEN